MTAEKSEWRLGETAPKSQPFAYVYSDASGGGVAYYDHTRQNYFDVGEEYPSPPIHIAETLWATLPDALIVQASKYVSS